MALLNVFFSPKPSVNQPLPFSIPPPSKLRFSSLSPSRFRTPKDLKHLEASQYIFFSSIGESMAKASVLAILTSSFLFVDPSLAFKGGGPYGAEVTRGQDLSGKDFSGRSLVQQDFKTSILRQANFKGAKLLGASFFDADLTGADLSDADLRGADFSLANVTKANLGNANLEGALATGNTSFRGSNITGAVDFSLKTKLIQISRLHRCALERRSTGISLQSCKWGEFNYR